MSENCTHDCANCSQSCSENAIPKDQLNSLSSVKNVIGVVSGKGGVGKSLVTSMLAVTMNRLGYKTAIIDADITGPSIPQMFGVDGKIEGGPEGLFPVTSKTGIDMISVNLLLENKTDPVVWRGPVIAGTVRQFWTDFIWRDVDYMFVDMPPGTGDVPLTVFQSLPVTGIVVVASPQELVSMIVGKAVNMAKLMNIPIIGMVENMSYVECPHCDEKIRIFGEGKTRKTAEEYSLDLIAEIPMKKDFANLCDRGLIELFEGDYMEGAASAIEKFSNK